jgi:hypothetical protein
VAGGGAEVGTQGLGNIAPPGIEAPPLSEASSVGMEDTLAGAEGGCAAKSSCRGGIGRPDCSCSTRRRNRCSRCCSSRLATSTSPCDAGGRSLK